ncbi:MAG TPA: DUF4262 domain-containing protein [Acidimicrobiales bacterium]|nr:DUF4262 domain-containing protein [Acidimicrobiales bacterium]
MCDGASIDEVRFRVHGCITQYGWYIQAVEAGNDGTDWAYTVGLSAGFDHPELVVVGLDFLKGGSLLNALAEEVGHGDMFVAGEQLRVLGDVAEPVEVNSRQFEHGTFATWSDYYSCLGPPLPRAHALQVWLPEVDPLRLDTASNVLGASGPNRAARRRRQRRKPSGRRYRR